MRRNGFAALRWTRSLRAHRSDGAVILAQHARGTSGLSASGGCHRHERADERTAGPVAGSYSRAAGRSSGSISASVKRRLEDAHGLRATAAARRPCGYRVSKHSGFDASACAQHALPGIKRRFEWNLVDGPTHDLRLARAGAGHAPAGHSLALSAIAMAHGRPLRPEHRSAADGATPCRDVESRHRACDRRARRRRSPPHPRPALLEPTMADLLVRDDDVPSAATDGATLRLACTASWPSRRSSAYELVRS